MVLAMVIAAVVVGLLLVSSTAVTSYHAYAQDLSMNEDLTLITSIEEIRGHLMQALNNKSRGNNDMAVAHAGHPAAEYLAEIAPIIEKRNPKLIDELRDKLVRLPSKVPSISYDELSTEINAIDALLEDASNLIRDKNKGSVQFWLEVIKTLLEHAKDEYEEGVEEEGKASSAVEYEDAQAFVARAEHVFTSKIKGNVGSDIGVVIERFFSDIKAAIDEKRSADRIKELVDGVIPVIPEFPVNLMLVFVGVVISAILVSRVMPMGSKMKI